MNDRYLFKAKRIDNGEWVQGNILLDIEKNKPSETYRIYPVDHVDICRIVDETTICQCTGLKDKNGKLIWENDVVKKEFYTDYDAFSNSEEYIGIVKVSNCAWVIETIRDECIRPIFEAMLYSEDVEHFEILGNVFDNPELLESEVK